MTKRDRETLFGWLILFGCVLYSGGLSAGLNFIKQIWNAVAEFFKAMAALAIQFPDEFGITDWLWTRGIFVIITIVAALLGYTLTRKSEKKLLGIISSIVSFVSLILTFT